MNNLRYLFLILCIFFFSCGDSKTKSENVLLFKHSFTSPNQQKVLNKLIKEFEKKYDCKILNQVYDNKSTPEKFFYIVDSDKVPDVIELFSDNVLYYTSQGMLAELNIDSLSLPKYKTDDILSATFKNKIFAIPWYSDSRVLYYNKNLLKRAGLGDKPPKTMSGLLNFSDKINTIESVYGFGGIADDPQNLIPELFIFLSTFNAKQSASSSTFTFNNKDNVSGFYFYMNLLRTGIMETQRQVNSYFTEGKLGFCIADDKLLDKILKENPGLDFGITLIPGLSNEYGITYRNTSFLGINTKCRNKELAYEFIKFLSEVSNSIDICKELGEGHIPANKDFEKEKDFINNDNRQIWFSQLNHSFTLPPNTGWNKLLPFMHKSFLKVIYGTIAPEAALNEAKTEYIKYLK
ncbi:MAG: extracellular solute-binding protein [FCB group bacterium]|jgi:ABC-type glycerol-3-phosphate transport system substrate-binding protein